MSEDSNEAMTCATPLVDLLRHVPADARLVVESDDGLSTRYIPIGRLASEAISELSRLQSLSDQNRLTGGWRDIESAPKDGTLILLYGDTPDGPRVTAGNWLAPEHGDYLGDCGGVCRCPEYDDPPEPLWWDTDGGFTDEWPPLGWQPFPSPPLPLPGGEEKR